MDYIKKFESIQDLHGYRMNKEFYENSRTSVNIHFIKRLGGQSRTSFNGNIIRKFRSNPGLL